MCTEEPPCYILYWSLSWQRFLCIVHVHFRILLLYTILIIVLTEVSLQGTCALQNIAVIYCTDHCPDRGFFAWYLCTAEPCCYIPNWSLSWQKFLCMVLVHCRTLLLYTKLIIVLTEVSLHGTCALRNFAVITVHHTDFCPDRGFFAQYIRTVELCYYMPYYYPERFLCIVHVYIRTLLL